MAASSNSIFLQSIAELYDSLPLEKKQVAVDQLKLYGNPDELFNFLITRLDTPNIPINDIKNSIDLAVEYVIATKDDFNVQSQNQFYNFVFKIIGLKVSPTSLDNLSIFLLVAFKVFTNFNQDGILQKIKSLPEENQLIPLTCFSLQNSAYLEQAFDILFQSVDNMMKNSQFSLSWYISATRLFLSPTKVNMKQKVISKALATAFKSTNIQLFRKFELLEATIAYCDKKLSKALIEKFFDQQIRTLTTSSTTEDVTASISLSYKVLLFVKEDPPENITQETVINLFFSFIIAFYKGNPVLNEKLTLFCNEIDPKQIQTMISASIQSNLSSLCNLFLVSHYPTPSTIPVLLSKRPQSEQKAQYVAIFNFLSNNSIPYKFLPRLLEILRAEDFHLMNEILTNNTSLYFISIIKFLSKCNNIDKIQCIAEQITKLENIPIVKSRYTKLAFITVVTYRIYSNRPPAFLRLLITYLYQCCLASIEIAQESGDQPEKDDEILCLDDDEYPEKQSESLQIFNVKEAIEIASNNSYCLAQVLHDWVESNEKFKEILMETALKRIQRGDKNATILIASISDDQTLFHNCVQLISNDSYLLLYFFSSAASCSAQPALLEMKKFIMTEPEKQSSSLMSRIFTATKDELPRRQKIIRRTVISMAPFVPFSQNLLDVMVASFPNTQGQLTQTHVKHVCESIIAVCSRLNRRESLSLLLDRLCSRYTAFKPQLLIEAVLSIIKVTQTLNAAQAVNISQIWLKLLLDGSVNDDLEFEKNLLDPYFKGVSFQPFIKELEKTILSNSDKYSLFLCLKRIIELKSLDQGNQSRFLTLFIANCLNPNQQISDFCVQMLRSAHKVSIEFSGAHGIQFSYEYIACVRPFLTELTTKFNGETGVLLLDALLQIYNESSGPATSLFAYFLISQNPKLFIQSKIQFVTKIMTISSKLTRNSDYPLMLNHFKILDKLAQSDLNLFFKQFIDAPENEFTDIYLRRFAQSAKSSEFLVKALFNQIEDYKYFNPNKCNFSQFKRLIKILSIHVEYFVTEDTKEDKLSRIIYSFFMFLSSLRLLREKAVPCDEIHNELIIAFKSLQVNTGISLCSGDQLNLDDIKKFSKAISEFTSSFPLLSTGLMINFVKLISYNDKTPHDSTICLLSSNLLHIFGQNRSSQGMQLFQLVMGLFFNLIKKGNFQKAILSPAIVEAASCFTVDNLEKFELDTIEKIYTVTVATIKEVTGNALIRCFEVLLCLIIASKGDFIQSRSKELLDILQSVISSGRITLSTIIVLNIIGEIVKQKQEPVWFLKETAISFNTLLPLALSKDTDVKKRAVGIIAYLFFGSSKNLDLNLLFDSLMSIFFAYEQETTHYVSMTLNTIKSLEKTGNITVEQLKFLHAVIVPLHKVGDEKCMLGLNEFIKFLKKLVLKNDQELVIEALSMMTEFAKPKTATLAKAETPK